MVVLARAPPVRDFEVQQRQETHGEDGLESTNRCATGLLDGGHVGFVKSYYPRGEVTGGGDSLVVSRSLYGDWGAMDVKQGVGRE